VSKDVIFQRGRLPSREEVPDKGKEMQSGKIDIYHSSKSLPFQKRGWKKKSIHHLYIGKKKSVTAHLASDPWERVLYYYF